MKFMKLIILLFVKLLSFRSKKRRLFQKRQLFQKAVAFSKAVRLAQRCISEGTGAFLVVVLWLWGCAPVKEGMVQVDLTSTPVSWRMLALGDSYTIGEGVPEHDRWPTQLAERLRARGAIMEEQRMIARTGWTTSDLKAAMQSSPFATQPNGAYDLVTLLIGVNNQYQGLPLEDYRTEFADLVQQAVALAGNRRERVVVISIPDWSVTPFAQRWDGDQIAAEIASFNEVNRAVSASLGVAYVDITPISRRAGENLDLLAADGLHPSGKMYSAWVDMIEPVVLEALKI